MLSCSEINAEIIAVYPVESGQLDYPYPPQVRTYGYAMSKIKLAGKTTSLTLTALRSKFQGFVVNETYKGTSAREDDIEVESGISVKASSKRVVAGDYYQTQVSLRSADQIEAMKSIVDRLTDADGFDMFIVDADDNVYLVRGMYHSSSATVTQNLPRSSYSEVTLSIDGISGICALQ